MALATYSDLKTSIANYLGRSDLTSQIPDFITLAEIRLQRLLRVRQMITTYTVSTSTSTVAIPADFLEARDVYLDTSPRQALNYLSPSIFSRDARTNETGLPVFYTSNATQFLMAPNPDTAYNFVMNYYAKPPVLSDSNTTNVFMTVCPDAMLYASLLEAEPYLMNDARLAVWSRLFESSVETLNSSDEQSQFSGVPISMTVSSR
jgi:hypothetical protein